MKLTHYRELSEQGRLVELKHGRKITMKGIKTEDLQKLQQNFDKEFYSCEESKERVLVLKETLDELFYMLEELSE